MTSAARQSRHVRRCGTRARARGSRRAALLQHGGGGDTMNEPGERPSKEQARGGRGTTTHLATTPWLASSVVFGRGKAGASSRGFGREMGREGGRE